ncbi:MAG: hypothetical protein K2M93_07380 [Muribaculaceae bacterium]|nr:hypothetical protein [Muribaculaceae bacterium]
MTEIGHCKEAAKQQRSCGIVRHLHIPYRRVAVIQLHSCTAMRRNYADYVNPGFFATPWLHHRGLYP